MVTFWFKILTSINKVILLLQSPDINNEDELKLIENLIENLERLRGSWGNIFEEASLVANFGFETEFSVKRVRKMKRFHDEIEVHTDHNHHSDEVKKFENEVYDVALDTVLHEIRTRFDAVKKISAAFSFIWIPSEDDDISECSDMDRASALTQQYPKDLNDQDFFENFHHFEG